MGRAFEYRKASKLKRWGMMSNLYPKLGKVITMAAKEGGSDPESNTRLRTAIMNAKAQNMPKDNIEKAIKRATAKDAANFAEVNYEAKGPHGVLLWIECATDNNTRTFANVRMVINKSGGQLQQSGAFDFMFSRKAVIEFDLKDDMDLEEIELELIDAGLEELEEEEGVVLVVGEYTSFNNLCKTLEDMKVEIKEAKLERIANTPAEFTDEQREEIDEFIGKVEEDEDVQTVFTNMA
ncbi:YebC/PmpR family DNA-binding transcriptional regulator [Persicirhabdus sediminis]|uniref:Probable transcriptional regulatory protein JIN82_04100 n=1 Tax=Persicirhabdus sediminis TaxID=454144 RepID=A0A8J7SLE3_9BACT|nr:YebC/PmpR family DNA-binding transcriptional regulator [Persicirhabdus sediminis]MBK1790338.1 YebC/PmpR family DNA-binding transcriptional regulator [Persicirhabdus sediminis]